MQGCGSFKTCRKVLNMENEKHEKEFRKIAEQEVKAMGDVTERLGRLEASFLGLKEGLEHISDELGRLADRTRPNTMGLFMATISLLSLIAIIGVMALNPLNGDIADIKINDRIIAEKIAAINASRYTPFDAERDHAKSNDALSKLSDIIERRYYRNEELIMQNMQDIEHIKGMMEIK